MNYPHLTIAVDHRGFTLIELMISVALGSLIVYTAVAGFRVASQSFTMVNQIARETAIIRCGLQQIHERLDFWIDCDDPDDPTRQKLRTKSTAFDRDGYMQQNIAFAKSDLPLDPEMRFETGLPFSPMNDVGLKRGVFRKTLNVANPEQSRGWDPGELWLPNDARTWLHGNCADRVSEMPNPPWIKFKDKDGKDNWRFEYRIDGIKEAGFYCIFSNIKNSITLPQNYTAPGLTGYGTVQNVPHTWYMNQIWGMHGALGFYGYVDYMPPNILYVAYGTPKLPNSQPPPSAVINFDTDLDGAVYELMLDDRRFTQTDENPRDNDGGGGYYHGKDLARLTHQGCFSIISPDLDEPINNLLMNHGQNYMTHQSKFAIGNRSEYNKDLARVVSPGSPTWQDQVLQYQDFINKTEIRAKVVANGGPAEWPKAEAIVKRFVFRTRFTNVCSVRWMNPLTGKSAELNFTAFGTTLRGARQQRKDDSGWAKWYGHPDTLSGQRNDITLDGEL